LIRRLRAAGTTIVLIDHNLDLAFSLADRVAVLDFGQLIAVGPPAQVAHDPAVRRAYLGSSEVQLMSTTPR
jgi:ABC-type branched-subunit amino acid transport system ATPase component